MNYLEHPKRGKGRGARGHFASNCCFANTKHLTRILLYLKEVNKGMCMTTISKNCCIDSYRTKDAVRFLIRNNFIIECYEKRENGSIESTKTYKIKEEI